MKKTWRISAFCMAAVMFGGSFALPAAAADDVAAQIKAASGEMYSVNTKALGYTAGKANAPQRPMWFTLPEYDEWYEGERFDDAEAWWADRWKSGYYALDYTGLNPTYSVAIDNEGNAVVQDGKYGDIDAISIIDKNGNIRLQTALHCWDQDNMTYHGGVFSAVEGMNWVGNLDGAYYILQDGTTLKYPFGTAMINGYAAVLESLDKDGKTFTKDKIYNYETAEQHIPHRFSLINDKGEKVLTLSEAMIMMTLPEGGGDGNAVGSWNYELSFGVVSESLIPFSCDRQFGYTLNDILINEDIQESEIHMPSPGGDYTLSNAYQFAEHKAGYADLTGKIVIPQKFDQVSSFREGLAWVGTLVDDSDMWNRVYQYGFIDKSGEYVIEPQFEGAGGFSEGLAPVKKDGKWGYIDKTGKFVIEPKYDEWYGGLYGNTLEIGAGIFSNGIAQVAVKDGDEPAKWGYINSKGETVLPLEYDDAFGTDGTYFSVGKTVDGAVKYGVVDRDGNTVLPFIFEDITAPVNGTVYAFYNRELYSFIISKANLESGDFDGDGEIGVADAQNVLSVYTKTLSGGQSALTDAQRKACDVNGDGAVDVADAQLILQYYVKNTLSHTPTDWSELIPK